MYRLPRSARSWARSTRKLFAPALAAALIASAAPHALAQPVGDPGLEEPAPKPVPPLPPPTRPTTPTPAPVQPTGRAVAVPPTFAPAPPPPEVKETVDVKTSYIEEKSAVGSAQESGVSLYARTAAPTLDGSIGLFRIQTAEETGRHGIRLALHIGGFARSNFLVAGSNGAQGDADGHVFGNLVLNYSPWKYLELFLGVYNASNKNVRNDPGRTDPEVILSMGDFGFGLKGRYTAARFIDLGLQLGVRFLNSVSGITFDGKSTNFDVNAMLNFDLRRAPKLTKEVPLRFSLNVGYLLDNSLNLLPTGQCAKSTGNDSCIRSRVVQTFAYGIGTSRVKIGLGLDAPITVKGVGIDPFVEYWAHVSTGDGDSVVKGPLNADPSVTNKDRVNNRAQQWMTIGLRLRPIAGLLIDLGVDVGLQSPGFAYGPPTAPWQVIAGLGYAIDPIQHARKTKLVEKTITREIARGPITGKLRGVVRDAQTKKVLGGVTIKYLDRAETPQQTADDGTFVSYGFAPGPVKIEASRDDYQPLTLDTQVMAGGETPSEILLTAKPPAGGQLRVKVNATGGQPVAAAVHITSTSGAVIDADAEGAGTYVAKLPAGDYTVDVVADGYLAKQRTTQVTPGQVQSLEVVLTKKPATSHVTIAKGEIVLKGVVHFGTNNAEIKLDGQQLLDEVADVIIRNPNLKKIRIEGHTDNRGTPQKNLDLSKARAASVREYLVKQGVDPGRLESEGYGAAQPLVPNLTPANRAKNRRVAFKIVEGGAQ